MSDALSIELEILDDKAEAKLNSFRNSFSVLADEINAAGDDFAFTKKITRDFDVLETKSNSVRQQLADIAKVRLDSGNVGVLTREVVRAGERSRQLESDIKSIRGELAKPNRQSSIKFLTDELKAAEKEAESLNRKLITVSERNSVKGAGGSRGLSKNTAFNRQLLELTDDFAPEGYNRAFNSIGNELLNISALSTATLATFGALAVAGYGIVKVTQNIREEAEKYLKVETSITAAINNQILFQQETIENLKEQRKLAKENYQFQQFTSNSNLDDLKRRRQLLESTLSPGINPDLAKGNDLFEEINKDNARKEQQIQSLDQAIRIGESNRNKQADTAFRSRFDNFVKFQDQTAAFEEKKRNESIQKQREANEKRRKDVEDAISKVKDLEKTYLNAFDSIYSRSNQNNPFVGIFLDGEKSLNSLKENLRGLPSELQSVAFDMQDKLNSNALFSAKLDNNLSAFNLREDAADFRNIETRKPFEIKDKDKFFKDYLEFAFDSLEKETSKNIGDYARVASGGFIRIQNKAFQVFEKLVDGGTIARDGRSDLLKVFEVENSLGGFVSRDKTFQDLQESEKKKFISSLQKQDENKLDFNDRLSRQLNLIQGKGFLTPDQQALTDRKFIALTSGVNPNSLSSDLREKAALAREREAVRSEKYEKDALDLQRQKLKVEQEIRDEIKDLNKTAKEQGLKGIENRIRIIDETNGSVAVDKAPTANDVEKLYGEYQNAL